MTSWNKAVIVYNELHLEIKLMIKQLFSIIFIVCAEGLLNMITDPDKNNWAAFLWIPRGHRIIKRELNIRKKLYITQVITLFPALS